MPTSAASKDRFAGSLIGLAIGDALGGHFESQSPDWLQGRFPSIPALFQNPPKAPWYYTDDTQMAIGVAEGLLADGAMQEESLLRIFANNYEHWRGYGRGVRMILDTYKEGGDFRFWIEEQFPGGSFGNGAAMRVAPVGLAFQGDLSRVAEQAELSARPTHVHPLGIEGAKLLAVAVALAVQMQRFDRDEFFSQLLEFAKDDEFRKKLERAQRIQKPRELSALGNGIAAQDSVVTAIACFALSPNCYRDVIGSAILNGGDTDTIAAMAGAVCGAHLGLSGIPQELRDSLENVERGYDYILNLANLLWDRFGEVN